MGSVFGFQNAEFSRRAMSRILVYGGFIGDGIISEKESIAMMIKVEQLGLFKKSHRCSFREASECFDRYNIWEFIDEAYYGLHVQGTDATFEDIENYIKGIDNKAAV